MSTLIFSFYPKYPARRSAGHAGLKEKSQPSRATAGPLHASPFPVSYTIQDFTKQSAYS